VKEVGGGAKEGVWGTRRDRESICMREGGKEEIINRKNETTIIKRQKTNNYGKMQRT